jgi:hypothetical protein
MFQSTIRGAMADGVVGELAYDGPCRAQPGILDSADAANNVIGRVFTVVSEGVFQAGGVGAFAGILFNPKVYASYGTPAAGPLAATMTLANNIPGEFLTMGIVYVNLPGAAAIGDLVTYNTTTGALNTVADSVEVTGSIATTTLTVTDVEKGTLAVGQRITGPNILPDTYITALGTGTGGTGTYTVNVSQTAASAAVYAGSVPQSGHAFVPNAKVARRTVTGAGLAIIELTN